MHDRDVCILLEWNKYNNFCPYLFYKEYTIEVHSLQTKFITLKKNTLNYRPTYTFGTN